MRRLLRPRPGTRVCYAGRVDGKAFVAGCVIGAALGGLSGALLSPRHEATARIPVRTAPLEQRIGKLGTDVGDLVRSVRALEAKVTALTPEGAASPSAPRLVVRNTAEVRNLARLAEQPTRTDELARIGHDHAESLYDRGTWYVASHHLKEKYVFKTYEDILREFGRPEAVFPTNSGSTVFSYPLPVPNTLNKFQVMFTFVDGMVVKAEASCSAFSKGR